MVRDRLAVIARERGMTVRDLVAELANGTPTLAELRLRAAGAADYLRSRVSADLDGDDVTSGEQFWREMESGRVPASLGRSERSDDQVG